jgi:hypothetical protein
MEQTKKGHLTEGGPILMPKKSKELLRERGLRRESWERLKKAPEVVLNWSKK